MSVEKHQPDGTSSLQSLLATVVIAVFVITFVVQAFQIPSESMENTLLIGDYLLVDKLCYGGGGVGDPIIPYRQIHRGDIIVFHYPVNPAQHFVKRVVGVPVTRNAYHALHEMLCRVHRIVEHDNVAAMDLPVWNDRIAHPTPAVAQFVDQQVVSNQ